METTTFATYVKEHPGASQTRIADDLGVSTRTIREYVHRANEAMDGFAHIDHERSSGYRLSISDAKAFDRWVHGSAARRTDSIPQTAQERVSYLLSDLLQRGDWVTLDDLGDILFVSRSTLSSDLKAVDQELARFGLQLERRPHYGIRVAGPEVSRRVCLAHLVMADYSSSANNSGGGFLEGLLAGCV